MSQPRIIEDQAVLVVEDDPDARRIIQLALEELGASVVEAENGKVAQQICKEVLPDTIILDRMMPEMSGSEFIVWLRETYPDEHVPVIMVTALGTIDNKIEGFEQGADDYLAKPFNTRELQARTVALLRTKQLTTKLAKVNRELQDAQEEIVRKERELVTAQLAGAAAHKLKQPVTSIMLHCHVLEKQDGNSDAATSALKNIRSECDFINNVISQLTLVDANKVEDYVGAIKILDLDNEGEK